MEGRLKGKLLGEAKALRSLIEETIKAPPASMTAQVKPEVTQAHLKDLQTDIERIEVSSDFQNQCVGVLPSVDGLDRKLGK